MTQVRISAAAEEDIGHIAAYTTTEWGWRQAHEYLTRLEEGLELLARNPSMGRSCDAIRERLRRFEIGSHVVFYLQESGGIFVVRVLHQRMLPANYF